MEIKHFLIISVPLMIESKFVKTMGLYIAFFNPADSLLVLFTAAITTSKVPLSK